MSSEITTKGYEIDRNVHFTYKAEPDKNALCQGDILEEQMHCLGEISETELLTRCVDDPDAKARVLLGV